MMKPSLPSTPTADASAKVIVERMGRVMRLLNRPASHYGGEGLAIMQRSWLTYPQVVTLFVLHRRGASTVCEIADHLNLSRGATSHLVDRLVRKKLVARSEAEGDRRYKRVSLAARGKVLVDRLNRSRLTEFSNLITALPPEFRGEFNQFLERLTMTLEDGKQSTKIAGARASTRRKI